MTADRTKREIANSLSVNNASLCFATKFPSTSELLRRRQAEKKNGWKRNTWSSHFETIQQLCSHNHGIGDFRDGM